MKALLHIAAGAAIVASLACVSCGGAENKAADPQQNSMVLESRDTTISLGLVRQFMEHIVAHQPEQAADMLYVVDFDDEDREPYPLTLEQRDKLAPMLTMPVTDFEIVDYTYRTPEVNEVQCRITVNNRIHTNWYFKPVRYLGDWYLCMKESAQGDYAIQDKKVDIAR